MLCQDVHHASAPGPSPGPERMRRLGGHAGSSPTSANSFFRDSAGGLNNHRRYCGLPGPRQACSVVQLPDSGRRPAALVDWAHRTRHHRLRRPRHRSLCHWRCVGWSHRLRRAQRGSSCLRCMVGGGIAWAGVAIGWRAVAGLAIGNAALGGLTICRHAYAAYGVALGRDEASSRQKESVFE